MKNERRKYVRVARALLVAAPVLAVPGEARADTYLPFVAGMSAASVFLFVVIVVLEALVIWRMLRASLVRAIVAAFLANGATTLIGIALAFCAVLAGSPGADFFGIPALFVISVVVEAAIVRRRLAVPKNRALAAAVVMNVLSYAVLVPVGAYLEVRADDAKREARTAAWRMRFPQTLPSAQQPNLNPYPPD